MVALEFEIPVETFGVEAKTIVGSAIGYIKGKNGLEAVVFWVNESNLADLYFSAIFGTKSDWAAVS